MSIDVLVVGGGAAGLCAARRLSQEGLRPVLVEGAHALGGHAHTFFTGSHAIDTAFQIYNETRYPTFTRLLGELGLNDETAPAHMSIGVHAPARGLDYTLRHSPIGDGLNLLRMGPARAWTMVRHFLAFRQALPTIRAHAAHHSGATVSDLTRWGLSEAVVRDLVLPLVSIIWSQDEATVAALPLQPVLRFFDNHDLLRAQMGNRAWRSFRRGCQVYVTRLAASIQGECRLGESVVALSPEPEGNGWAARLSSGEALQAQRLVLATPAPISADLLKGVCPDRAAILGQARATRLYANSHVRVGGVGQARLPGSFIASWVIDDRPALGRQLYYNFRTLRRDHPAPAPTAGDPFLHLSSDAKTQAVAGLGDRLNQRAYSHFVLGSLTDDHLSTLRQMQGMAGLYLCGSYFGAGFHEDAVASGLQAAAHVLGHTR